MTMFFQRNYPLTPVERTFLDTVIRFERSIMHQRWRARYNKNAYDNSHGLFIENQFTKNAVSLISKDDGSFKLELLSRNPHEPQYLGSPFTVDAELSVIKGNAAMHMTDVVHHLWLSTTRRSTTGTRLSVTSNPNQDGNKTYPGGPLFADRVKSLKVDYSNKSILVELDNISCKFTVPLGDEGLPNSARVGCYFIYNLGYSKSSVKHLFASEARAAKLFEVESLYTDRSKSIV